MAYKILSPNQDSLLAERTWAAEFHCINRCVQFHIWDARNSIFLSLSASLAQKFNFPPGYSQPDAETDVCVPD